MIIYVLAPDQDALDAAKQRYTDTVFRCILLPQTPYLESYMYTSWLMDHHDEWKDHDWVGCIAHTAHTKQRHIMQINDILTTASKRGCDMAAFMHRGDPLVETAEYWHPGFTKAWTLLWNDPKAARMDAKINSFYCNYWATTPRKMEEYCALMVQFKDRIDRDLELREAIWQDSSYSRRGSGIASISESKCQELWGVPYYPLLPFVFERVPCLYFSLCDASTCVFIR
jgi:hypothetical protein